jgi:predicted TIM-barrel fold metal-dependent hydrolase
MEATMSEGGAYGINDADNHFNEPKDTYVRYIDPRWREKAIEYVIDKDGRPVTLYAGKPPRTSIGVVIPSKAEELVEIAGADQSLSAKDPVDEHVAGRTPGLYLNRLNPFRGLNAEEKAALVAKFRDQENDYFDRDRRLVLMDSQGINAAIMFPSGPLYLEFEFQDDVDAIYANTRAFNRWVHEEMGWGYLSRMFIPAYLSLADPELAVKEIEIVLGEGAQVIEFMPGHAHGGRSNLRGGRSIADPIFDPVWARINEAGARVATHSGGTDYPKYGADFSENPEDSLAQMDAFQWMMYRIDRPCMETVGSMILHGLFSRFPNIRVCLSEQGCVWLPYTVRRMDHVFLQGRKARWGKLDGRPSEIFREHFVVAPYPEENVQRVLEIVGVEPIVFGSDFPHAEGLAYPNQYADAQLVGLPDDQVRSIMADNLARYLGIPTSEETKEPVGVR